MRIDAGELGVLILDALGENAKDVLGMTLRIRAGHASTLTVHKLVRGVNERGDGIVSAFKRYTLTPK